MFSRKRSRGAPVAVDLACEGFTKAYDEVSLSLRLSDERLPEAAGVRDARGGYV
jgi:hypothetical protein